MCEMFGVTANRRVKINEKQADRTDRDGPFYGTYPKGNYWRCKL